jgi:hypothetical protein
MAALVPCLPITSITDGHRNAIRDSPGYHPFTNRKVTPAGTDLAVYLAASLQHEGTEGGYPAKQPKNNV